MWTLVKYRRYGTEPSIIKSFEDYPTFAELVPLLLDLGIKPRDMPRIFMGGSREHEMQTYRFLGDTAPDLSIQQQLNVFNGTKGLYTYAKELLRQRTG